jgi:hypothetical protein
VRLCRGFRLSRGSVDFIVEDFGSGGHDGLVLGGDLRDRWRLSGALLSDGGCVALPKRSELLVGHDLGLDFTHWSSLPAERGEEDRCAQQRATGIDRPAQRSVGGGVFSFQFD